MMKKLMYLTVALLIMVGCKKTEELTSERSEVRMYETIKAIDTKLAAAENGWIASLPTYTGGGYGFFMKFDGDSKMVKMYADLDDESADQVRESSYRVRADVNATISFDTYNYISKLIDPAPAVFGGVFGEGFRSDIEFLFDRSTTDSILFIGKRYRQPLILVRASAQQESRYQALDYKAAMNKFNEVFFNQFRYIDVQVGNDHLKVDIDINSSNLLNVGKRITFTGVLADGTTAISTKAKFAYTIDDVPLLNGGLLWQGIRFVRFGWVNSTTLAVYDSTGKEYIVKTGTQPMVPLHQLWGIKFTRMLSTYQVIYPGTSTAGAAIINELYANMANTRIMGNWYVPVSFIFTWDANNNRLKLAAYHRQTYTWNTAITYAYTGNENNQYVFTQYAAATGGYAKNAMVSIDTMMLTNTFSFDYYQDNGVVYGKMTSITDPSIVMTFMLE